MKRLRRGGKNTQNYTKKILMIWITTVAWSLTYIQTSWSVKSSGPKEASLQTKLVEATVFWYLKLFKILKDDAVKCCTQYVSKFRKLSSGHRTDKGQFSFQSQRRSESAQSRMTLCDPIDCSLH